MVPLKRDPRSRDGTRCDVRYKLTLLRDVHVFDGFHTDDAASKFWCETKNGLHHSFFLCSPVGIRLNLIPVHENFDARVKNSDTAQPV